MQYMSQGLPIAIIGYCMVFIVLCFLWGILEVMRIVLAPKKKEEPSLVMTAEKNETQSIDDENEEDEEELIAVFTAAIASSLNTSTYNLKIKSFKRIDTKDNAWSKASRIDAVNKF